jgi:Phage minor capsid protein 2
MMDKAEKLIAMYSEAHFYLIALIQTLEEGATKRRKEQLLKQIHQILAELSETTSGAARDIIDDSYQRGAAEALRLLKEQGVEPAVTQATMQVLIHKEAVQAMVDEVFYRILECNDNMAEDVKERIEEIVARSNRFSLLQGVSRREATKHAIAELTSEGITGIVAKNGAVIPADKYMANVIQYHQRKAHVEGVLNRMTETGHDLVYINFVGLTCDKCAKYQGRVYSVSGEDERFPRLEERPPYHGHCVHSATPWVEEYHDELEVKKAIKDSNKPFTDSRTEKNIKKYEEMQRETSQKNETRKQWIRYKARMPDLPDLRTFASQKARNTAQYQQWMADYREVGAEFKKRGG